MGQELGGNLDDVVVRELAQAGAEAARMSVVRGVESDSRGPGLIAALAVRGQWKLLVRRGSRPGGAAWKRAAAAKGSPRLVGGSGSCFPPGRSEQPI